MSRINDLLRRRILLLMFGAPGSGKSTFGARLATDFGFKQLVIGNLLRKEAQRPSVTGDHIKRVMCQGLHVDDDLICNVIRAEIMSCSVGTILDGAPRTSAQAAFVKSLAISLGLPVMGVDLLLDRGILIERLLGRRHCVVCHRTYNVSTVKKDDYIMFPLFPTQNDLERCPGCSDLKQRADDTKETIQRRLGLYDEAHLDVLSSLKEVPIMRFRIKEGLGDYMTFKSQLTAFLEKNAL